MYVVCRTKKKKKLNQCTDNNISWSCDDDYKSLQCCTLIRDLNSKIEIGLFFFCFGIIFQFDDISNFSARQSDVEKSNLFVFSCEPPSLKYDRASVSIQKTFIDSNLIIYFARYQFIIRSYLLKLRRERVKENSNRNVEKRQTHFLMVFKHCFCFSPLK